MAAVTGVDGQITIPAGEGAYYIQCTRWTCDFQRDIHEVTTFGADENTRDKVGGMYHATGSFEGYWADPASPDTPDLSGMMAENHSPTAGFVLTLETGKTYTFAGIIGTFDIGVEKVGMINLSGTFESSGEITVA